MAQLSSPLRQNPLVDLCFEGSSFLDRLVEDVHIPLGVICEGNIVPAEQRQYRVCHYTVAQNYTGCSSHVQ